MPLRTLPHEAIDDGRLERGSLLATERLGPMQFRIRGQDEPYYDVNLELDTPCDCKDARYRNRRYACKHELMARMVNGDIRLLNRLGAILARRKKHEKEHRAA